MAVLVHLVTDQQSLKKKTFLCPNPPQWLIMMATLQVAGAFSLRTGFGPSHIKGPSGKGWSRGRGIYRRDLLCSDCKARAENRLNGSAEEKPAPEFKQRDICWVLERRDLLDLPPRSSFYFHLLKGIFFCCNKSDLHITLNKFCTGFDPFFLDFYACA